MALVAPVEHKMDYSKLMFLMDDGNLRTPREFSRSISYPEMKRSATCPEMSLSPGRSHKRRTDFGTSLSYPNTANTTVPRMSYQVNQSVPGGRTSKMSCDRTPRTPTTAIAYYSPISKPEAPLTFSASFSRATTNADFSTFSRQSTRIWTHSRPSTRDTSSNLHDTLACVMPVPTLSVAKSKLKTPRKTTRSKRRTKSNSDPSSLKKMASKEREGSVGSLKSEKSEKSHTGTIFLEAAQKGNIFPNFLNHRSMFLGEICKFLLFNTNFFITRSKFYT